jgi:hypothetical protein
MIQNLLRMTCLFVAAFLLTPSSSRASDPVKDLENALKIDPQQLIEPVEQRKRVDAVLPKLKTIGQIRGAYFLKEWLPHVKYDREEKKYADPEMFKRREKIGEDLKKAIFNEARVEDADHKVAIAMMIAEMADRDASDERAPTGKFASAFVGLLIGGKTGAGLTEHPDIRVRQAAWYAIGKVTPKPNELLRLKLRRVFTTGELGPRRLAAYGLSDLVKNSHYFESADDEMDSISLAVEMADFGLRRLTQDEAAALKLASSREEEWVRGYCLQAIHQAARVFTDYGKATESAVQFEASKDGPVVLAPKVAAILKSIAAANPNIAAAIDKDGIFTANLRLAALETTSQIISARTKILDKLNDREAEVPLEKRVYRSELFKKYKAADPIGYFLQFNDAAKKPGGEPDLRWNWEIVRGLLRPDNDVRVRRGAILLLEGVTEDVESAVAEKKIGNVATPEFRLRLVQSIRVGLVDPDHLVRWSAARAIRYIAIENLDGEIVRDLGRMLIDYRTAPTPYEDRDANVSATALSTLDAIASSEHAWNAAEFLKAAVIDVSTDVEFRVAAVKTLVQIYSEAAQEKNVDAKARTRQAVNSAFPQLAAVLANPEEDARLRRASSQALGQIGLPPTSAIADHAVAALRYALRDEDAQIRQNASEALLLIHGSRK